MTYDRDDYRCMSDEALLELAEERGIDEELAIVLAEKLAAAPGYSKRGKFRANYQGTKTHA